MILNKTSDNMEEDNGQGLNMSVDNSKDGSDLSDFSEENTTCQLVNHTVRAKLLSSVANAVNGNESKLRVSVFDHKVIPKRFIVPKKVDGNPSTGTGESVENSDVRNSLRPRNLNAVVNGEMDNRRKVSSMSYSVLKSGKCYTSGSSKTSPTSPGGDSENDVRTRFDILLRKLIGDVDDMQVQTTPTPATVSSGYESDYLTNKDVNTCTKRPQSGNSLSRTSDQDKENINVKEMEKPCPHVSETNTFDSRSGSLRGLNHGFSSLPNFSSLQSDPGTGSLSPRESQEAPPGRPADRDSQGFSYTQRHNYKLTKVTRNMYEIIHDLQSGEKTFPDNRKRYKKGRKSQELSNNNTDNGNGPVTENRLRGREFTGNVSVDNEKSAWLPTNTVGDSVVQPFSGAVVRCVRRPPCIDPYPVQRSLSHNENSRRATDQCSNNSNKVQNDLRNLLCGTSDVTTTADDNYEHQKELSTRLGCNDTHGEATSTGVNRINQTGRFLMKNSSVTTGQSRPSLNDQFSNRSKPDDHVYETIPGDEKLYEEWKKMRENPTIPKIRRFTTIPDLPGTFIPKEPPALPERKYLNSNQPHIRDQDNYMFMGNTSSRNSSQFNVNSAHADSGYTTVSSDNLQDSQFSQFYPIPFVGVNNISAHEKIDETSDGYCSIDNLSLLRETITHQPHGSMNRDTFPRHGQSDSQNDYFLSPVHRDEVRGMQHAKDTLGRNDIHWRHDRYPASNDNSLRTFRSEPTKSVVQATYV